ncbi:hypothetical protein C8A00DRAFT_15708 [Chaetomidium leptoderma]|uniref:Uncharacterized protein n=1 Tax=Chaetomidium leptoderma TaxID=669021 RepID=A0AAN6VKP5_9PEZI|nr:hypothetical protein C8A00DRAFT_15708 [Chaetomidium leptoderma]
MASDNTHYRVYLATYLGVRENPNHHAIYVESEPNLDQGSEDISSGHLFHVKGSTLDGMQFELKRAQRNPLFSFLGKSIQPVGWVSHDNFRERIERVCQRIPPPHKQFTLSGQMFPNVPPRDCHHWALDAIHALCAAGVLEPLGESDDRATLIRCRSKVDPPGGGLGVGKVATALIGEGDQW